MIKDYIVYVGTYGDEKLSNGAIKSVRKNCSHDTEIVLINFKNEKITSLADKIINTDINIKFFGFGYSAILQDPRPSVYIDDDVRLISSISLKDRYDNGIYKPKNGSMIAAWDDVNKLGKQPFFTMTNWRMNKYCQLIDDEQLMNLCSINKCEQIDFIWIHLDKCSWARTQQKQELIDYIDNL